MSYHTVYMKVKIIILILVPDKDPGNCLDPEFPGNGSGSGAVGRVGQAGAGPGPPNIWGDGSTDQQGWRKCAEIPPASLRRDMAELAASRVRTPTACIHIKPLCSIE
jgi:hypothetical protein